MSEPRRCPQCDAEIPVNSPAGLCPRCLLKASADSQSAAASAEPGPTKLTPPASGFVPPTVEELAPLFPQLEILELLGKGGMGAVYKARQPGLDRLVALKILPPEISHDPAFAERFQREARALARLNHPHIVAVYDFGQTLECGGLTPPSIQVGKTAGSSDAASTNHAAASLIEGGVKPPHSRALCFIVMEFVDGANLRQAMRTGTLTSAEALAIVPQICEALQFAHDEGIVHRDIKPENILIDKRGRVKIADFGLAKLMANGGRESPGASLTATHQVMGTLRYMAPEQMQGSREVDHRADIYSLGVVFYELLTGELPMGRFAPPSKRVQVDVRLDEIVLRALEQEPEQRYQHASDVRTAIEKMSNAEQVPQPPSAAGPNAAADLLPRLTVTVIAGVVGGLTMAVGAALAAFAILTESPSSGEFWGWMGGAFGCFFGGGGALIGAINSYRQLAGAGDLLTARGTNWLDRVLQGYGLLGCAVLATALTWSTLAPSARYASGLLGTIVVVQAGWMMRVRTSVSKRESHSSVTDRGDFQ